MHLRVGLCEGSRLWRRPARVPSCSYHFSYYDKRVIGFECLEEEGLVLAKF